MREKDDKVMDTRLSMNHRESIQDVDVLCIPHFS